MNWPLPPLAAGRAHLGQVQSLDLHRHRRASRSYECHLLNVTCGQGTPAGITSIGVHLE
jgi:hypothetical protein